jgi:hypothetical protein
MITHALGYGLKTAARRPRLALMLWAWNLAIAAIVTAPVWRWWTDALSHAPAADGLLDGLDLAILAELTRYDRTSVWSLVRSSLGAGILAALVTNALVVGGVLEVLLTDDARSFMHRFFRGAGHFFWRFLRMLVMSVVAGLIALIATGAVVGRMVRPLAASTWEPGWVLAAFIQLVILGLVVLWFYLALDYARIRVALDDSRLTLRAWLGSLGFVCRRFFGTYAITTVIALLLLVLAGLYLGYCEVIPAKTRAAILLMLIVQQAFMIVRSGVRVAHLGAEVEYYRHIRAMAPVRVVPAASAPPVSEPPVSEPAPEPATSVEAAAGRPTLPGGDAGETPTPLRSSGAGGSPADKDD